MKLIIIDRKAWEQHCSDFADFIHRIEQLIGNPPEKDEWLDNETICRRLGISKRTLQRMRSADRISYKMIYGRCYYALHDIEEAIRNKSLYCNPQNLKELRHNFELKSRRVKDGTIG